MSPSRGPLSGKAARAHSERHSEQSRYDPENGELLRSEGIVLQHRDSNSRGGECLIFVSSGYVGDKLRPLIAFRRDGSGALSPNEGAVESAHIAWRQLQGGLIILRLSSMVITCTFSSSPD